MLMSNRVYLIPILTIVTLLMSVHGLMGQSAGQPGAFTTIGFSPRGIAIGNAATAVDQFGVYGYYNPALSAKPVETVQVDFSTALLSFDRQLHMISGHFSLPPMAGLSIGLINARVSDIDGRTQSGYHTDYLSVAEYQLFSNFGVRFSENFWGGIGLKYNYSGFHSDVQSASGIGIDLGAKVKLINGLSIGMTIKDLLAQTDIDTGELYNTDSRTNTAQSFPVRMIVGASYDITQDLTVSLDIENRFHRAEQLVTNTIVSNGFETTVLSREPVRFNSRYIRSGSSYAIHERLTLRGGLQLEIDNPDGLNFLPSFGFSLHLPFDSFSPSIDYAIMREPGRISNMHVFSVRLNI